MIANIARMVALVVILALLSACTRPVADLKVETEHDCIVTCTIPIRSNHS
ncbi:MAG: hypothetical protein NZM94_16915 [Roseiflexus sp.]|nr:hypothetical protein [Roseiflexus sp.]